MVSTLTPQYRIAHVGINHPNGESALETAQKLCDVFGLAPYGETATHIFSGSLFELKKNSTKGTVGHIAMQTDDIEMALEHLKKKGVGIRTDSIKRNSNGKIRFVYLELEIAGFAFHLTL